MNLLKPMTSKISSGKKKAASQKSAGDNFSADELLDNPTTKKVVIQKLLSVPEVRQLIIKTIMEKVFA